MKLYREALRPVVTYATEMLWLTNEGWEDTAVRVFEKKINTLDSRAEEGNNESFSDHKGSEESMVEDN